MIKFLGVLTLALTAVSSSASYADASQCKLVNFSGKYRTTPDLNGNVHALSMKQDGCKLEVTERWTGGDNKKHSAIWNFDLAGVDEAHLPQQVLNANRPEFAYKSLASLGANTTLNLKDEAYGYVERRVLVNARMTIPAVQTNKLESTIAVKGSVRFFCSSSENGKCEVGTITFENESIRMTGVPSWKAIGSAQQYFLYGANYILGFLDGVNYIGLIAPQMQTITRAN